MFHDILVPIDGSACSAAGLDHAIGLARASGARLHLLHVLDAYPMVSAMGMEWASAEAWEAMLQGAREAGDRLMQAALATARAAGVAAESDIVEFPAARVADAIVEEAGRRGAGLIVIGSHGRRGISRLMLGSDAERVLRTASVPVLVVHAPAEPGAAAAPTAGP